MLEKISHSVTVAEAECVRTFMKRLKQIVLNKSHSSCFAFEIMFMGENSLNGIVGILTNIHIHLRFTINKF